MGIIYTYPDKQPRTLREIGIIADLVRQGKTLLDANKLKKSDLYTDMLFMLSENDSWNDNDFADTYYKFEDEISETLHNFRG